MQSPLTISVQRAFRYRLRQELAERCARNPRYSVRAFALWLRVDHSTLAQLIRGVRPITEPTLVRLGIRLGLDPTQVQGYLDGAIPSGPTDHPARSEAILALIARPGFRTDCRWIARTLGTTIDAVNRVLPELLRTHQLVMVDRHRWSTSSPQ